MLLVLEGDISPKLITNARSLCGDVLPETEPPTDPVIVGTPPDEMSSAWADTLPRPASDRPTASIKIRRVFISYGAVTVNVTDIVEVPFS